MSEAKSISAKGFLKLDRNKITLLDIREQDEIIIYPLDDAINIPFSQFVTKIDELPHNKPIYVLCNTGDLSEQVAEILADRDYEVYNIEGGVNGLKALENKNIQPEKPKAKKEPVFIDAKGMKCPGPIVKVGDTVRKINVGDQVYVEATEDAFASDIAVWCERTGNKLVDIDVKPQLIKATVEKGKEKSENAKISAEHEKTFVVFSGELDKTIASFIMANGATAMGRKVTMFFTFWGLNILRKPEKVKVKKNLIGKMFGAMMPKGSKKLGLSKMNMGGIGAKMIRAVMKKNGISSLEELMQNAIDHGVKIVACQMSMDIMGIKPEELIDGVEMGGVATMLGSAEKSDLTYFI